MKDFNQIKDRVQSVTGYHSKELDNFPDVSAFSDEVKTELRNKYLNNAKERAVKELDNILSDVTVKKDLLQQSVNEKKFPATNSAFMTDEKLQMQIIRQRAEALAMSQLDFNIVNYLKKEIDNNNIDFINYFRDAVKLNSDVDTSLKSEMNSIFNSVDLITGVKALEVESQLCSAYENQINIYKDSISNNDQRIKMQLIYVDNEINKLESELTPTI